MVRDKSTLYALVGSLAVNIMITIGAGSFLISINKSLATQKIYKLEFVKRKVPPPPIKKKKIRKQIVHKKIKVPVLQPKVLPVVKQNTVSQPKTSIAKSYKKIVHKEIKMARLQPKALPVVKQKTSVAKSYQKIVRKEIKMARLQSKVLPTIQPKMTARQTRTPRPSISIPNYVPRKVQTDNTPARKSAVMHASNSIISRRSTVNIPTARSLVDSKNLPKKGGMGRITPVISGMKHASLSLQLSPREVPNIVDRGALKGYIVKIQRIIENAKKYPEASRKAGREGKIKVQFTIFRDGKVDNIKLLTQSPYPNLNKEAMNAVRRAAPFSGFPDSVGEKSLNIILPFKFELR